MDRALDHLVLNTRFETDAARDLFESLGFTLTPRGHHSLGSINHLMVFAGGYLELIGLPLGTDKLRQEVLDSPVGLDGLVLATADADATEAAMTKAGFAMQPVRSFSRPVDLDGEKKDARFRTARLQPGEFAAGRVYFCEQQTPELVWRPEWMTHANGVTGLAELVVVSPRPVEEAKRYALLGDTGRDFAVSCLTREAFDRRYGALAAHAPTRSDFFGAVRVQAADPQALLRRAAALGLPVHGQAFVLPAFQALIEVTA
jgi:hypothetical protein